MEIQILNKTDDKKIEAHYSKDIYNLLTIKKVKYN